MSASVDRVVENPFSSVFLASAVQTRQFPAAAYNTAKNIETRMQVRAIQDRGCLGSAKFFYQFPAPVGRALVAAFSDCEVVLREFSKIVPYAKDLVSIRKSGEFSAAIVIGAHRAVVHFNGPADDPPREQLDSFARRLLTLGYTTAADPAASNPPCGNCPAGSLKACPRASGQTALIPANPDPLVHPG